MAQKNFCVPMQSWNKGPRDMTHGQFQMHDAECMVLISFFQAHVGDFHVHKQGGYFLNVCDK